MLGTTSLVYQVRLTPFRTFFHNKTLHTVGNQRFRESITSAVKEYLKAGNRFEKSLVVHGIVESIRARGGRFLKKNSAGNWYELSDQQTKEKVGHAVRDAATSWESRGRAKTDSGTGKQQMESSGMYDGDVHYGFGFDMQAINLTAAPTCTTMSSSQDFTPVGSYAHFQDISEHSHISNDVQRHSHDHLLMDSTAHVPVHAHGKSSSSQPNHPLATSSRTEYPSIALPVTSQDRLLRLQQLYRDRISEHIRPASSHEVHGGVGRAIRDYSAPLEAHDDQFLDQINEVLGPLQPDDSEDAMEAFLQSRRRLM